MSPAVRVSHLHFRYRDGLPVLDDVEWEIGEGERWAVVGGNGSGKSTLLHHLVGLHPAGEHVIVFGVETRPARLREVRARVGFVFQNPEDQLFLPTLQEDVAFGPANQGLPRAEVEARVRRALGQVGLLHKATRPPHHLSGGEKRAAALATVLALDPELLVLDEPTNDLDPASRREMIDFLREWPRTLVLATHDLELVLDIATHVAVLARGRVVRHGDPATLLAEETLMRENRLEVPPRLRRG